MANPKTELKIGFRSYKTFFGRDAGEITIRSNGKMYDGVVEVIPCKNCGGPILRFQQRELEGIIDGAEIYSHKDKKCCGQWSDYLNSHQDIKEKYAQLARIYNEVAGRK